ncbi:MAG: L,D-transpeptidase family protein [Candidatus Zixiibacteriota bacterium]
MLRYFRILPLLIILQFILIGVASSSDFKQEQLKYSRVRSAFAAKESKVRSKFEKAGVPWPPSNIFIRIFKAEETLELWAKPKGDTCYKKIEDYEICSSSGVLGPKRKQGDRQVPEGFYYIDRFNGNSKYHLSLGINYPNASDRILGFKRKLGGDIFIHGACVTIGCVPITDSKIKELYIAAVEAKNAGQERIPVHIFPFRMSDKSLKSMHWRYKEHVEFWKTLKVGYDWFEKRRFVPQIQVDKKGSYTYIVSDGMED